MPEIKLRQDAYTAYRLDIAELQRILGLCDVEIGTIDIDDNSVTWDKLAVAVQNSFLKLSGGILTGQLISDDISDILGNILLRHKTPDELHMSSLKISAYTDDNDTYGENVINSYGGNLCLWAKSVLGVRITNISDGFELDSGGFHFYDNIDMYAGKTVDGIDVSEIPATYLALAGGTLTGDTVIEKTDALLTIHGLEDSTASIYLNADAGENFIRVKDEGSMAIRDGVTSDHNLLTVSFEQIGHYAPTYCEGDMTISKSTPRIKLQDGVDYSALFYDNVEGTITFESSIHVWGDILVDDNEQGLVLIDRVTGLPRRLRCDSGVLSTEAV